MRLPFRWSLLTKVSVMTAVCFVGIGVALANVLGDQVRERLVQMYQRRAEQVALEVNAESLDGRTLGQAITFGEKAKIDRLRERIRAGGWVHDIKVWNPEFRVLHTPVQEDLGSIRRPSAPLRRAMTQAVATTNFSRVHASGGEGTGRLFEVYAPLVREGGTVTGVVEVYLPYAPVARAIREDTRAAVAVVGGGLLALYVLLLPIVGRASRALRRQSAENHRQAHQDELTGLPNRRWLLNRLVRLESALDHGGPPAALLLIDLDRFKDVNDALGHHHGDTLLRQASRRMRGVLRDGDELARLGGDEFAVLLPRTPTLEDAVAVTARLRAALEEPFELDGVPVYVEGSVGIALWPHHGRTSDELLRHADVAMYAAKTANSGWSVFEPEDEGDRNVRLSRLGELRRAITRDELVLHYQPKIDVATRRLVGVEALARWQHPEHGLLAPGQFIPIAEQSGLIGPLTATVLEQALEQARAWLDAGTELTMAVNVAPRVLADADFPDSVARALAAAGVPPHLLELEITESGLMQEPARTFEHLERLHALGVRLSIDDFGTGFSSLSRLRRLPIDQIKIDRSFVGDLQAGGPDAKIVRSAIGLGQSLGLRVIAEGVETEEVLETLAFFGCDEAQGFHIARPLPAQAFEAWMAEHAAAFATPAA